MNRINEFFRNRWAIGPSDFHRMAGVLLSALSHGHTDEALRVLSDNPVRAYATTPYLASRYELTDPNLPAGSVAVIELDGPLYGWETLRLEHLLSAAMRNDAVEGVVLWVNGPGGMISRVDVVAEMIAGAPKPVATYVASMMASAHFWIGSAAHRTFVASPMCEVGSVGVLLSYQNLKGMYQQMGIDVRDIYPDSADLKNRWYRDIEDNGDETAIKARLAEDHRIFCESVSRYLGIPYDADSELFRGATFSGSEAVRLGIIDQEGTLEDAARWVLAQATVRKANDTK